MEFEPFNKIGRMNRDCTVTEKIDGTNAQILFDEAGNMLVGSRKRQIWPEGTVYQGKGCDNMGFALWAHSNRELLFNYLGEGRHYGEWAGQGIQRGYGLDHKRFYLFNTFRWNRHTIPGELAAIGLDVVPTIYEGIFNSDTVNDTVQQLRDHGSFINNFKNPEGVIVYHHGMRTYAKVTCTKDDSGKGKDDQSPS